MGRRFARRSDRKRALGHLDVDVFAIQPGQLRADVGVFLVLVEIDWEARRRGAAREVTERGFKQTIDLGFETGPRRTLIAGRRQRAEGWISITDGSHGSVFRV